MISKLLIAFYNWLWRSIYSFSSLRLRLVGHFQNVNENHPGMGIGKNHLTKLTRQNQLGITWHSNSMMSSWNGGCLFFYPTLVSLRESRYFWVHDLRHLNLLLHCLARRSHYRFWLWHWSLSITLHLALTHVRSPDLQLSSRGRSPFSKDHMISSPHHPVMCMQLLYQ